MPKAFFSRSSGFGRCDVRVCRCGRFDDVSSAFVAGTILERPTLPARYCNPQLPFTTANDAAEWAAIFCQKQVYRVTIYLSSDTPSPVRDLGRLPSDVFRPQDSRG